jgi:tetratricopeptide (TPR) repeat protein
VGRFHGDLGAGTIDRRAGEGFGLGLNRGPGIQGLTPGGRPTWNDLRGSGAIHALQPGGRPAINLPGMAAGLGGAAVARHWYPGTHTAMLPGLPGFADRQRWVDDHRLGLNQRLHTAGQQPWHARPDFWKHYHKDWHAWLDHRYPYHHGWHGGYWHGDYWHGYWRRLWYAYPLAAAFPLTAWSCNALAYDWGLYPYGNPYWVPGATVVYDYSQPVYYATTTTSDESVAPAETPPNLREFEQARAAFYEGDYRLAQRLADAALRALPHDAVIHEFRALCQFALGDYRGAAATLNAVLAVGPGWDWATLASLYPRVDVYTVQLRALERYIDDHPDAGDARFLLAYHYLTTGAKDAAIEQLREVVRLVPKDMVAKQLLDMLNPAAPAAKSAPAPAPNIPADRLQGTWKATGAGGVRFELTLTAGGQFVWKHTRGGKTEEAKGVYALQGDTLAMEPETGGVMLAQVTLQGTTGFVFKPIGGTNTPPVTFGR